MKKKVTTFDVWIERKHIFTARVVADNLEQALDVARHMTLDELLDAPGDTCDSEHKITGVMKS